jgi:hypothetical protein
MNKTYEITLNIKYKDITFNGWFTQNDVGNVIEFTVFDGTTLLDLTGMTASVFFEVPSGDSYENPCVITDIATCNLGTSELSESGWVKAQLKIYDGATTISTNSFTFEVREDLDSDAVQSTTSYGATPTISSGTGVPTVAPTKIGNIYIDTTNDKYYIAVDTTISGWADYSIFEENSNVISTVNDSDLSISLNNSYIIGNATTNGSIRFNYDGTNILFQKRIGGAWVTKYTYDMT